MPKPRIAIIEDDATFSGIYRSTFESEGFSVSTAKDGESGYVLLAEKPDVAVIDLMLPHMTGLELLERLQRERIDVPVIVVTNLDQQGEAERAMALGAKAYFVKAHAVFSEVLAKVRELTDTPDAD